jgi:release factor glutamine methyltransferase
MSQSEPWTIGRLLTWTSDFFKQRGFDTPRLDAEVLLAAARGCKRIELYTAFDQEIDEVSRGKFRELVRRRGEGEPVAYLVGHREFFSLRFKVNSDVLIPRPETESLVVRLLDLAKHDFTDVDALRIADVGTGSGIIAISAAKHLPSAKVTAIDRSSAALVVAHENAVTHNVVEKIGFLESDLFSAIGAELKFHLIASNPPYVGQEEFATLAPSVRNFEPHLALVAGARGTEVIERLLPQAAERLFPGGWLLMEVSPMIEPSVRELVSVSKLFELGPTLKDSAGHPRVVQAKRKS